MPDADEGDVRAELREIGERRAAQEKERKKLSNDTQDAIKRAKGRVPMTEIAKLVGLERTSMYHTYVRA